MEWRASHRKPRSYCNGPRVFGFLPPSNAPLFGGIRFNQSGSHRGRGSKQTRTAWATAFLIRDKSRWSEWDDLSADLAGLCRRTSRKHVVLVV